MLLWNHAGGKVYAGLTCRRAAEGQLFAEDVAAALATADVHKSSNDPIPRRLDRPRPPAAELAKRTRREQTAAKAQPRRPPELALLGRARSSPIPERPRAGRPGPAIMQPRSPSLSASHRARRRRSRHPK
jgi:hypothetical protein